MRPRARMLKVFVRRVSYCRPPAVVSDDRKGMKNPSPGENVWTAPSVPFTCRLSVEPLTEVPGKPSAGSNWR